jgi:hypothetical protein
LVYLGMEKYVREMSEYSSDTTYGTPESEHLHILFYEGFNPIGITVMVCEETFIFETTEERDRACEWSNKKFGNEGWWYSLFETDRSKAKYDWDNTRKWYIKEMYKGVEEDAPKVYWFGEFSKRI